MGNRAVVASVRREDGFGVVSNVASPHFERQLRGEGSVADGHQERMKFPHGGEGSQL